MNIALYARVSTRGQQQTQTIDQQLDRLRLEVAKHTQWHLNEAHVYRDDGYSGAKLNRPGLDRLRDRAQMAAFELVLITAPDRLARKYVHQVLLIEELGKHGCRVEFLDRPMSDDPHDRLLLQIRGAVAEYERTLIADRMRRGRQAKLRSGTLLPWTKAPYGYILDLERPRDPSRLRIDPVKAEVVKQIFAWYSDPKAAVSLYWVAKTLSDQKIPTPSGKVRWNVASVRGILRSPTYAGTAYSGRTQPRPARRRKSALQPVGPGESHQPAPPEEWIAIAVPAIISQETFDLAQSRLDQNKQMARRNNSAHAYLLRGLVSCAQCRLCCRGRTVPPRYHYYVCQGRTDTLRAARGERCSARYAPADKLDALVWQDLCRILADPALITHELARAQAGEWLPQALQDRRRTVTAALAQLERQQARLLEVYLAEVIGCAEFERKRVELDRTQQGLRQQLRELEAQAQKQFDVAELACGIEAFCQRVGPTLDTLSFAQRRQLVELLIDRVVLDDEKVEIRYVIPTSPKGEKVIFCHLRLDYFDAPPQTIDFKGLFDARVADDNEVVPLQTQRRDKDCLPVDQTPLAQLSRLPRPEISEEHPRRVSMSSVAHMGIVTDANVVGQAVVVEGCKPLCSNEFAVGHDGFDQDRRQHAEQALNQGCAFSGVRRAGLGQKHPDQGVGCAPVDDARHENVDLEAAKTPVRPVNRDDEVGVYRHQAQYHLGPGVVVKSKAGEETLDAPVVGSLARGAAEGIGDFRKIDRGDFHQGQDEGDHEGDTGAIPVQVLLQHGMQFGIVEHGLVLLE